MPTLLRSLSSAIDSKWVKKYAISVLPCFSHTCCRCYLESSWHIRTNHWKLLVKWTRLYKTHSHIIVFFTSFAAWVDAMVHTPKWLKWYVFICAISSWRYDQNHIRSALENLNSGMNAFKACYHCHGIGYDVLDDSPKFQIVMQVEGIGIDAAQHLQAIMIEAQLLG